MLTILNKGDIGDSFLFAKWSGKMKKFFCSTILVFALALICVACGSTDKKDNGDAVAKSEEVKNEQVPSDVDGKENNDSNDWITEWIKSNSSDDEICAVGSVETTKRFMGEAMTNAVMDAKRQLCILQSQASYKKSSDESSKSALHTDSSEYSFECNLPAKMKGQRQSMVNEYGRIPIYVLVCVDRKDLEENKKESEEATDQTDEDKVVQ